MSERDRCQIKYRHTDTRSCASNPILDFTANGVFTLYLQRDVACLSPYTCHGRLRDGRRSSMPSLLFHVFKQRRAVKRFLGFHF